MRNQVFKKLFSVLLALIMVAGLLPASVLAEGEGNADSTPAPTEAVQPTESAEPTEPTKTETPEVTEVPEPTPENPAATVEPTQGEPTAEPTDEGIMPANVMPVQANVAARDTSGDGFIRIFHLDCGRKYFSVSEINGIIDQLAENNYTHIQLAFGNDGFRFILNEMSVTVGDNTYDSDTVKNAITGGNSTYSINKNAVSTTLSQSDMDEIISHAKSKNIGVIPMLNTPGHMHALVSAMQTLGIRSTTGSEMDLNSEAEVNFIKALQQKYIAYFAEKGSDHYNFAADEYSFSSLNDAGYTKFAEYVNALANMVKKANMTPMAYNDGIYYSGKTTSVPFDTDIQICYWSQATNYASVTELAEKGFQIINNNDAWYYVLGDYLYEKWSSGQWGYQDALDGIKNTPVTQAKNATDRAIELAGSVLCCWCDGPSIEYTGTRVNKGNAPANQTNKESVYALIKAMADANPDYFKKEAVNVPAVEISENGTNVKTTKETVDGKTVYKAAVKADGTSTIKLNVVNIDNTVNWASDNDKIATVDGNGLVTFMGVAGIVTITATPVAATRSINGTAAYSITFNVTKEGEIAPVKRDITLYIGQEYADTINGYNYDPATLNNTDSSKATATAENVHVDAETINYSASATTDAGRNESYYVNNVIDGSANTKYYSGGPQTVGQYVQVELTNAIHFNAVRITTPNDMSDNNDDYCENAAVEISNDGNTWINLGSYTGSGNTKIAVFNNEKLDRVKFIRVRITRYKSNWWQLAEIEWGNTDDSGIFTRMPASGTVTTEESDNTTVTIKGVAEGDTTVTIGHVTYNVHVIKEDLTNVSPLPVQLWITNVPIEVTNVTQPTTGTFNRHNNDKRAQYVAIDAKVAYGSNGVLLADLVPKAIGQNNAALESGADDRNAKYVFWKGTVLNNTSSGTQTLTEGIQEVWTYDRTLAKNRIDYTYVRYLNSTWEVSSDRESWQPVTGEGSTGSYSTCKQQIIAYYMQRTDVTNEIITDVVDWGNTTEKWDTEKPKQYVVLDFAVQYPTERIPATFPVEGKSVYYHCNERDIYGAVERNNNNYYRRIGLIKGINTDNYEVYMITVTPTSDTPTDQLTDANTGLTPSINLNYNGTEKVVWVDDEANLPVAFRSADAKYKSISGKFEYSVGGNPNVAGLEIYQRQGMLVTYYLRPKVTTDTLHVYYIDKDAGKKFYDYPINVISPIVFDANIGLAEIWKGPLANGTVKNDMGKDQTVSADLSTMPAISAQYRYGNYECVEVTHSTDCKNVYLYYTFRPEKTFVVDFGLPLNIKPTDVSKELEKANITAVQYDKSYYATITEGEGFSINYTLTTTIGGVDNFQIVYKGTNLATQEDGTATFTIRIIPATNVYYEDSFAKFTNGSGAAVDAKWTADGKAVNDSPTQALEALGEKTNHNVYGYDPAYDKCTMFSMGSARKVTVTSDMAKDGVVWPTAQFTFKGTGFDIISLTDNTSGAIFVFVYKGTDTSATGTREGSHIVDNYYGYTQDENGNWVVNNNANNALYQIPVMRIRDLEYGEYTAVVKVFYDNAFDHTATGNSYSFWLDAVRVYDPMGKDNAIYNTGNEKEGYPQYIKLRDELANNGTVGVNNNLLFIDGAANATIEQYKNLGPNNEVYLASGQAITFKLAGDDLSKIATVQIGAKSPNSNETNKASMVIGSTVKELGTATEMYYDITDAAKNGNAITITNNGNAILSLTNLKITYTEKGSVSLGAMNAEEQTASVMAVRALFAPAPVEPEPEKTFEPERFEASWSRNVIQGRKATLTVKTSTDVEAITVDGQTIRSYRTRTERVGFGRRAKRITYREFTYSMVAQESADFSVTAINAEGIESEAITARLTVKTRPNSMRDMWDWFKGWF